MKKYNKKLIPDAPDSLALELHKVIHDILSVVHETYTDRSEYKTIKMNLKNVSKELNNIRLSEVGGEINEDE